jgi:hypothetical protein
VKAGAEGSPTTLVPSYKMHVSVVQKITHYLAMAIRDDASRHNEMKILKAKRQPKLLSLEK